jgi:hypothetical protein
MKNAQTWNCDINKSENLFLKSVYSTKSITPVYNNEWRISETNKLVIPWLTRGPPLLPSCQSFWLQIQRPGFDSQRYQIFWELVGLERVPLSVACTIEELFGRKSSCSGLENREHGFRNPSRWPRDTLYLQKVVTNFADKRRSFDRYSSLAG